MRTSIQEPQPLSTFETQNEPQLTLLETQYRTYPRNVFASLPLGFFYTRASHLRRLLGVSIRNSTFHCPLHDETRAGVPIAMSMFGRPLSTTRPNCDIHSATLTLGVDAIITGMCAKQAQLRRTCGIPFKQPLFR